MHRNKSRPRFLISSLFLILALLVPAIAQAQSGWGMQQSETAPLQATTYYQPSPPQPRQPSTYVSQYTSFEQCAVANGAPPEGPADLCDHLPRASGGGKAAKTREYMDCLGKHEDEPELCESLRPNGVRKGGGNTFIKTEVKAEGGKGGAGGKGGDSKSESKSDSKSDANAKSDQKQEQSQGQSQSQGIFMNWIMGGRRFGEHVEFGFVSQSNFNTQADSLLPGWKQFGFQENIGGFFQIAFIPRLALATSLAAGFRSGGISDAPHLVWDATIRLLLADRVVVFGGGIEMDRQGEGKGTFPYAEKMRGYEMDNKIGRLVVEEAIAWGPVFQAGLNFWGLRVLAHASLLHHPGEKMVLNPEQLDIISKLDPMRGLPPLYNAGWSYYAGIRIEVPLFSVWEWPKSHK